MAERALLISKAQGLRPLFLLIRQLFKKMHMAQIWNNNDWVKPNFFEKTVSTSFHLLKIPQRLAWNQYRSSRTKGDE